MKKQLFEPEYMVGIEINIAKGIVRWLEEPENELFLVKLKAFRTGDYVSPIASELWVAMDAFNWLGDHLTDTVSTFSIACVRAWRYYDKGNFEGDIYYTVEGD